MTTKNFLLRYVLKYTYALAYINSVFTVIHFWSSNLFRLLLLQKKKFFFFFGQEKTLEIKSKLVAQHICAKNILLK